LCGNGTNKLEYVSSTGVLTVTGQISRDSNNYWNSTGFMAGDGTSSIKYVSASSTLTVTGKIQASTGYIGGWTIDANGFLKSGTTYLYGSYDDPAITEDVAIMDLSRGAYFKSVYAGSSGFFTSAGGDYYTTSGDFVSVSGNVVIGTGYINLGVNKTFLYSDGQIYADTLGTTTRTPGSGVTLVQSTSGYIKVYVSSSSQRYKENITTFDASGIYNIIKDMRPVTFNYKPEFSDYPEQEHLGLIAEEVHDLEPNGRLVEYKDGVPESVVYEKIPMYLVAAFKEMASKIEDLQLRLDALEG
jgi:hypothetical protein